MALFDLPAPEAPPTQQRGRAAHRPRVAPVARQLAFAFYLRRLGDHGEAPEPIDPDDLDADLADEAGDHPQHLWIKASEAMPQQVRAPFSVFDLATHPVRVRLQGGDAPAPVTRVERDGGRVRLTRIQVQDTEEWQERERARRARQKPPRPVKAARTKSQKLIDMIGRDSGQDDNP